jgi:hypothetical protein
MACSLQERIPLVRLHLVRAVLREFPLGLLGIQTDLGVDAETLEDLVPGKDVPVEIGDFLGCIALGRFGRGALLRVGHMDGEGATRSRARQQISKYSNTGDRLCR